MGYEYTDLKDFIEDKGLPELDLDFAIDSMNKKDSYRNPLFIKPDLPHNSISYDFHDPMSKPPVSFAINPGMPSGGRNLLKNYDTDASMIQPSEYDPEKDICKVCLNTQIDTVCIPCGHRCICKSCGQGLKDKTCPICRKTIKQIVKTFDA